MAFTKITNTELNSRGATTLPNQPTISAAALKQEFDAPAKEIVAPHFNNLIDELEADTAGASIGLQAPSRRTGSTVKAVVDAISQDLVTVEGKLNGVTNAGLLDAISLKHGHENKALLDTYDQTNEDIEDAVNQKHSHSNKSVLDKWSESEGGAPLYNGQPMTGDMYSSEYDPDSTVKNAGGIETYVTTGLGTKVDKVDGKGLSTNDYSNTDKNKVDILGTSAYKNSTSVVTDSTDLVESGAVKDIVGWGNKNLCFKIIANANIESTGVISSSSFPCAVAKVKAGKEYTISPLAIQFVYAFFTNEPVIGSTSYDNSRIVKQYTTEQAETFTSPIDGYVAVRFSSQVSDIQIELGSTATAYEPYHASVEQTMRDAQFIQGKNYLPNDITTQTVNGITFAVQEDGAVIANGTASADWARVYFANNTYLPVGNYLLSGVTGGATTTYRITLEMSDGTSVTVYDGDTAFSITEGKYINKAAILIRQAGYVANNVVFKPMIRKATETDATYEPYYVPLKDVVPTKADNSVIGTVEDGTTASQAYAVNDIFIRNGALCKVTSAISQGDTLSNQFTVTNVGAILTALLNA